MNSKTFFIGKTREICMVFYETNYQYFRKKSIAITLT